MSVYEDMCALAASFRPIPRRELHCHQSVMRALREVTGLAPEPGFLPLGDIGSLTGIDVFEKADMPFGAWELREGGDVIDSGVLRFTVIPAEQELDERLNND